MSPAIQMALKMAQERSLELDKLTGRKKDHCPLPAMSDAVKRALNSRARNSDETAKQLYENRPKFVVIAPVSTSLKQALAQRSRRAFALAKLLGK